MSRPTQLCASKAAERLLEPLPSPSASACPYPLGKQSMAVQDMGAARRIGPDHGKETPFRYMGNINITVPESRPSLKRHDSTDMNGYAHIARLG
jgi:hypothetical protein